MLRVKAEICKMRPSITLHRIKTEKYHIGMKNMFCVNGPLLCQVLFDFFRDAVIRTSAVSTEYRVLVIVFGCKCKLSDHLPLL